jgi:hypothetical protein
MYKKKGLNVKSLRVQSGKGPAMGETGAVIIPADKKYRKKAAFGLLVFLLISLACVQALVWEFKGIEALAETDGGEALGKIRKLVTALSAANAVVSVALALWFFALAYRILESGQYPPPGMRVFRDTRLRTGRQARAGAALQAAVALLLLSTNLVMLYLHRILDSLEG